MSAHPSTWGMYREERPRSSFVSEGAHSGKRCCIFVHEPNRHVRRYIQRALEPSYRLALFEETSSLREAFVAPNAADLTLLAWSSSEHSASLLQQLVSLKPNHPILLVSSVPYGEGLATALQLGARDIIHKPFVGSDLKRIIGRHLQAHPLPLAADREETSLSDGYSFVRSSQRMREIEARAAVVARSDIPVLVLGESGTGKEVLARYIHASSHRSKNIFMKLNCAAMPADLLESELFGYEKGAFTGAVKTKPGKFEVCNGGTIFLDEIGEMPAILQAKLLHVLQDGTYSRLGGRTTMRTDVRVVAATNINMKAAMAQKTFREDLYYRLNGFSLTLPPLRERRDEIPVFAEYFMEKSAMKYQRAPLPLPPELLKAFSDYSWPGNLRELENILSRYLIIGDAHSIIEELHPRPMLLRTATEAPALHEVGLKGQMHSLKGSVEAEAIARTLKETQWNRKAAAARMKISYRTLLYKIRQYELTPVP